MKTTGVRPDSFAASTCPDSGSTSVSTPTNLHLRQRQIDQLKPTHCSGGTPKGPPVAKGWSIDAERLGLHVETAVRSAPIEGDPRLIERLVANLVDNAIGHNVASGRVHIATEATGGKAVLTVNNTGPAIPPDELDRLF